PTRDLRACAEEPAVVVEEHPQAVALVEDHRPDRLERPAPAVVDPQTGAPAALVRPGPLRASVLEERLPVALADAPAMLPDDADLAALVIGAARALERAPRVRGLADNPAVRPGRRPRGGRSPRCCRLPPQAPSPCPPGLPPPPGLAARGDAISLPGCRKHLWRPRSASPGTARGLAGPRAHPARARRGGAASR